MAQPEQSLPATSAGAPVFGLGDIGFLCLLIAALVGVVLSGRFAYREGMALETAKANAHAVAKWAEAVAATGAQELPMTLALCSATPGAPAQGTAGDTAAPGETDGPPLPEIATTWSTCREALFTAGGPLSHLANPFLTSNPVAGNKCEKGNPATRGLVVMEKGTPSPPGMPPNVSWAPLEDHEPMVRGLMLRLKVCDAGGYLLKFTEVQM